ncbi:MAG TPA: DUF5667 domain-containing protein [Candidatus Limnocylindria bacterium]|nr:DUF5667 domain-containing protein [Candidatus Limnocylindria bacterium]
MRASRPETLDRLIESVARGERELASIKDAKLRDAVRVALRMHSAAQRNLDELARIRMRDRVLGSVRPRRPNFADRVVIGFELLAKPAPYAARAITVFALSVALVAGGFVAGAETLPDDVLYPMKLASEDLRLTLALSAEDRASVQLSIAAHRFAEAQRLALSAREHDALVASSTYSQQIAEAAAELAELEELQPEVVALAAQLDDRFNDQRARMQALAHQLSADPVTARVSEIIAVVAAPTLAPGLVGVQRIAETAAGMAEHLATRAAREAAPQASPKPRATRAAEVTRRNAEQARAAAERAKAKNVKNRTSSGHWIDERDLDEYFLYREID